MQNDNLKMDHISYEDMLQYVKDCRLILHKGQQYYALIDETTGERYAVCEIVERTTDIHINCLRVPDEHQGHHYAEKLLKEVIRYYWSQGFLTASAQANDCSINTFLNLGFDVSSERQFKKWKAFYVKRRIYP